MLRDSMTTIFLLKIQPPWSNKVLKMHLMLLWSWLAFAGFNTPAIADLDGVDRALMHRMIEQYIMENPEVKA